jgi:DNA-binding NarL/FixJ family response regulator/anti-sigma regulatory factor (Ser/Thr protein kinase)
MGNAVRVMVVDDSSSTRTMLREALSLGGDIEVVGEAGGGREAISIASECRPDVVLMDVRMPDMDGVAAARALLEEYPQVKVVALTWSDDPSTVRDMLTAGAIGYVVKGGTIDELSAAIRRAATGEAELDQRVLPAAVEDLRRLLEEERERRAQIERLARARAEFVQVLSHELRTPLTVISGALRMLEQSGVSALERPIVESAIRRVGELEFLVEGLELVAAGPSVEGTTHVEQAIATASERLDAPPDQSIVKDEVWEGVPHKCVERVAFELLSNATRHGVRPIEVAAWKDDGFAVLSVGDAGGWVPPSQDFAAFFQEDMSATRTHSGFGLGLFVASRLCQACEGDLSINLEGGRTVAEATFRLR